MLDVYQCLNTSQFRLTWMLNTTEGGAAEQFNTHPFLVQIAFKR